MSTYERLKPEALQKWLNYNEPYPNLLEKEINQLKENVSYLDLPVGLASDLCKANDLYFNLFTLKSLFQ